MRRSEAAAWPLLDAALHQATVIGALVMREIHTRYGRENLGFLWFIAEPLLFCLGVMALWSGLRGDNEHGIPMLAFVITGYLPLTLWRHVTNRAIHCLRANSPLLYHRQVKIPDLLLARVVLEVYGVMIAYLVIAFVFSVAGLYQLPRDWGMFYLGWFYFVFFATGIGLLVGALTEISEWGEKMVGPFMYLMLPVCGCFYMADWLPQDVREMALWIPTVNAFEMIRAGQFGASVRVHYDLAYTTASCALLLAAGLLLLRRVHRHLVIE